MANLVMTAGSFIYNRTNVLLRRSTLSTNFISKRNTWKVERVIPPPATIPGAIQRRPEEKKEFMLYKVTQSPADVKSTPLQVILTTYVEGYGNRGDVVSFENKDQARRHILIGSAVYASPFNLQTFTKSEISSLDDSANEDVRLTKTSMPMARILGQTLVQLDMNVTLPWTLNPSHIKLFLRKNGILCNVDNIVLPPQPISGPNFDIEWVPIRFYIIINKQIIVPMLARIHHVSGDETAKVLSMGSDPLQKPTDAELEKAHIVKQESIYVHAHQLHDTRDAWDIMQAKAKALIKKNE